MRIHSKAHQWAALCYETNSNQIGDWLICDSCGIRIPSRFLVYKGDRYFGREDITPEGRRFLKEHPETQTKEFYQKLQQTGFLGQYKY